MNNKQKTVFLTGATGLVGSYLLKILLQEGYKVYVLARGKDNKSAKDRVIDVLNFWDKKVFSKYFSNLTVLEGDVTEKNLGLDKQSIDLLRNEIEEIFHCAAITNYRRSLGDMRKVNVAGTKRILDFAVQCERKKEFKKVNYISSAYVCGNYKGVFKENDLDVGQQFKTSYGQSKFEAEKLIGVYRGKGLWVDIFRPPIVMGESKNGKIPVFQQHFYQIFHIWSLGIFDYFPGKGCFANIVPVDELSKSIVTISSNTSTKNGNYHLFSPPRILLENILNNYKNFFRIKKPKAVSAEQLSKLYFTSSQKIILKNLFFTFNSCARLDSKMTNRLLKKYGFIFSEIDNNFFYKVFKYLAKINFFNKPYLLNKNTNGQIR